MTEKKTYDYNAYMGMEPYVFASYAHTDTPRVEAILRILYRQGFRVWYDQQGEGIEPGAEWYKRIIERIDNSRAFVGFISNGIEFRTVVLDEITRAIEKNRKDPDYKILLIFLEKVPFTVFPKNIKDLMRDKQFIELKKYGGITEKFVKRLLGAGWPETVIDPACRKAVGLSEWNPSRLEADDIRESVEELFKSSDYVYQRADYSLSEVEMDGKKLRFYQISPEQTDPETVYPLCMDNQWVPVNFFNEKEFQTKGFTSEILADELLKRQREEIYRGLLHNWQILVNRASLINSKVFIEWYSAKDGNREEFGRLMKKGAVAAFLFREVHPCEKPGYDHDPKAFADWRRFCLDNTIFCLRLDWENEQSNKYETDKLIGYAFQNFCLTTAFDGHRLEALAEAFQIEETGLFAGCWNDIQKDVICWKKENQDSSKLYNRERFYTKFIADTTEGRKVSDGILDLSKNPFVRELKQIIDFQYSMNLPEALGIQPLIPMDSNLKSFALSEKMLKGNVREINADELLFAVSEFKPDFLWKEISVVKSPDLMLSDITMMRDLPEWIDYMNAVSEGKKRARLSEIDLYDISTVWVRYQRFISEVKEKLPGLNWQKQSGSLSVIYRFEELEIITVYRYQESEIEICQRGNREYLNALNRKMALTVDYVCGDILQDDWASCMLTEIRLFEGVTHVAGDIVYQALLKKLEKMKFQWQK